MSPEEKSQIHYDMYHKIIDNQLMKKCYICEEWFPCTTEYFYKNKSSRDGINTYCKQCTINKSVAYGKKFPERKKIWNYKEFAKPKTREYLKNNSKRRRENGEHKKWQENNKDRLKQYQENRQQWINEDYKKYIKKEK